MVDMDEADGGDRVWVPEHYRNGVLVAGHWRRHGSRSLSEDAEPAHGNTRGAQGHDRVQPPMSGRPGHERVSSTWLSKTTDDSAFIQQIQTVMATQRDLTNLHEIALAYSPVTKVDYGDFGGCNTVMLVKLKSGQRAYHKPISGMDEELAEEYDLEHAGEQALHEVAAWRVAKAMGGPYDRLVAPAVLRDVDGHVGSTSLELPGRPPSMTDYNSPADSDLVRPDAWDAAALFDAVIGNQDRHLGNVMHRSDGTPGLFDHGLAFRSPGAYVNDARIQDARLRSNPELTTTELTVLRTLRQDTTLGGVVAFLPRHRVDALRDRVDHMIATGQIYDNRRDYEQDW